MRKSRKVIVVLNLILEHFSISFLLCMSNSVVFLLMTNLLSGNAQLKLMAALPVLQCIFSPPKCNNQDFTWCQ